MSPAAAHRVTARPRILLVDDEEHVVRALTYVLEREGFEVRAARDGDAALEAARGFNPDVILLEVEMSVRGGLEALARIREQETLKATPVLLMCSQSKPRDVVAGLERGADDFITKPFDPREVLARIRAQIRIRNLQMQVLHAERWRVLVETAGGVAHEMSQPLTAVMGNLELLLMRLPIEDPMRATIQRAFENGERAVELLRKLQRIESYELKSYPGTEGILDIERSSKIPG